MKELSTSFLERIGIAGLETVTFDQLPMILEQASYTLPFENSSIILGKKSGITKEIILEKILNRKEGGVCYELNPALYVFLADNGMDVRLVRGAIHMNGWSPTGRTHVAILLRHQGRAYLN